MRYMLDEALPGSAAEIARGLGLDATSVHETRRFSGQWLRAELGLVQLGGRRRMALSHALK